MGIGLNEDRAKVCDSDTMYAKYEFVRRRTDILGPESRGYAVAFDFKYHVGAELAECFWATKVIKPDQPDNDKTPEIPDNIHPGQVSCKGSQTVTCVKPKGWAPIACDGSVPRTPVAYCEWPS